MNKILAIIIFLLSVLTICVWVAIDRLKTNDSFEEICYTINKTYNLFTGSNLQVDVYDSKADALVSYAEQAEAYLYDQAEEIYCKVKITDVSLVETCFYQQTLFYHFVLELKIDINEITLKNCFLELNYPQQSLRLHLGDINYLNQPANALLGVRELYGLTFNQPYLSLGAIVLNITNLTEDDLVIEKVAMPSNHQLYLLDETSRGEDLTAWGYRYKDYENFEKVKIKKQESQTLLIGVGYLSDKLLMDTPLIITINAKEYYVDSFSYFKTNDLDALAKLLHRGYLNEF